MSMEAVFAALAGWLLLGEQMQLKEYIGCVLMLCGMLLTQIPGRTKRITEKQQYNEPGNSL
jgi:drug/metabolite transporter (DMT)-like permease